MRCCLRCLLKKNEERRGAVGGGMSVEATTTPPVAQLATGDWRRLEEGGAKGILIS